MLPPSLEYNVIRWMGQFQWVRQTPERGYNEMDGLLIDPQE